MCYKATNQELDKMRISIEKEMSEIDAVSDEIEANVE